MLPLSPSPVPLTAAAVAKCQSCGPRCTRPAPSLRAHPACPAHVIEQIVPLETLDERLAAVINGSVDASINSERVLRACAGRHGEARCQLMSQRSTAVLR